MMKTTVFSVTATDANGCAVTEEVVVCVNNVVCKVMNTNYKVFVCHIDNQGNPNTLCVAISAVATHLAHGDQLGTCESVNEPCVSPTNARRTQSIYPAWEMKAFPNPFHSQTRIEFFAPENEWVKIEAFDIHGNFVRQIFNDAVQSRRLNEVVFEGRGLANGVYLVRLIAGEEVRFTRVVLMK